MNEDVDWNLLAKYLFGERTEEEEAQVRKWMEKDPKRMALLRQFRHVLESDQDPSRSEQWDTEALWDRIEEETRPEEEADRSPSPSSTSGTTRSRPRTRRRASRLRGSQSTAWKRVLGMGVAVAAFVATGLLWGALNGNVQSASAEEERETFATEKGERATVRLSDGTHIRLNVNSHLTVPKAFGEKKRTVELEGEAFFEVTGDSSRPFVVKAGGTMTRVLGTAFDVSAYPEDTEAKVIVEEGRVALRSDSEQTGGNRGEKAIEEKNLVLTKHQMARVLENGEQVVYRELDVSQHLAWMEGELLLRDASFEEVSRSLERWYGLEISVKGERAPSGHLNARFARDQDLDEVLGVVATAFRYEYKRHRKTVTFFVRNSYHSTASVLTFCPKVPAFLVTT